MTDEQAMAECVGMGGLEKDYAALSAENARLRAALEGWVKYFQTDVPRNADDSEAQGEEFTRCWFETKKVLSPNK